MLRVLKPGKRMAFAVWHFRDKNPFHHVLARIVDSVVPTPGLPHDAPEPFRFAAAGKLRAIAADAGGADPMERLFRFSIDVPLSPEDFWNLRMEMSEKLRERLATLPPDSFAEFFGHLHSEIPELLRRERYVDREPEQALHEICAAGFSNDGSQLSRCGKPERLRCIGRQFWRRYDGVDDPGENVMKGVRVEKMPNSERHPLSRL